jgi:transcriptional regulator with XRE-family HTH domain
MMSDLGKRVRAARGYTNLTQDTLVESLNMSRAELERLEVGLDEPDDEHRPQVVAELARATRLPESFFTGDYDSLEGP